MQGVGTKVVGSLCSMLHSLHVELYDPSGTGAFVSAYSRQASVMGGSGGHQKGHRAHQGLQVAVAWQCPPGAWGCRGPYDATS